MVRSSGTNETLDERGRLISEQCRANDVSQTLQRLAEGVSHDKHSNIHWVIQKYAQPRACGHLSNERRVSRENRDWVLAVDAREGYSAMGSRIAVRRWRDGEESSFEPLLSSSVTAISVALKRAAKWATQFSDRLHFEWLWDGTNVFIVQADAATVIHGVKPADVLPKQEKCVDLATLKVFRQATGADAKLYKKLKNVQVYKSLDYTMPQFYVLDNQDILNDLSAGTVRSDLESDLESLTGCPLIIRTDGTGIPAEKREMLPRSDELCSVSQATTWLKTTFSEAIARDKDLADATLCLIAHHFIPSVSSAWARAEPGRTIVRIESLWGLPEGLYWYSHDTFEVDTQSLEIPKKLDFSRLSYRYQKRLRYKGSFVGPDSNGDWITYEPAEPYDWGRSIRLQRWLFEIAIQTRRIAEIENGSMSVMWLVDNQRSATRHAVLPWYHERSDHSDVPKAAPQRKWSSSRDVNIRSQNDWDELRQSLTIGMRVERVRVEPKDPSLIRNAEFATELGELAKAKGFVIELSGGVLSHVYYLLRKTGAPVECVDLFGVDEDIAEFHKVVRDKVPELIVSRGERANTVRLTGDALVEALKQKLVEEAFEALDSGSGEELIGEVADVLEVIRAIASALEIPLARVEQERKEKRKVRGGFDRGLMLTNTATPHSLHADSSIDKAPPKIPTLAPDMCTISDPREVPSRTAYRKQDQRKPNEEAIEKLLTVDAVLNRLERHKEVMEFAFHSVESATENYSLTLELHRDRSILRTIVKLRKDAVQMELELSQNPP